MSIQEADAVVRAVHHQALGVVSVDDARGRSALLRLLTNLRAADRQLADRLRSIAATTGGGPSSTFSAAQARAYQAQIQHTVAVVSRMMAGEVSASSVYAIRQSLVHTAQTLTRLETAFAGVVTPLRLREAMVQLGVVDGVSRSLLRRHEASIASYGAQLVELQEGVLAQAMLQGLSQSEAIDRLMETGSYGSQTWRAWRTLRTETAYAYAQSRRATLEEMAPDVPDLRRVIVATFDNRTALDSVYVHGQVRALDQPFTDGAGRVYLDPPGRPNDREVTIPWRARWPATPHTRPLTDAEREGWRVRIATRKAPARRAPRAA